MGAGITFSGLSSGIDTSTIIEQLIAIERRPITLLENQQTREQFKLDALQLINTSLLTAKTSAEALSSASAFDVYNAASSDTDLVGVSVTGTAAPGDFTVEVLSLAQYQTNSSGSFSSDSDALGFSGELVINGGSLSIAATDSLSEIRDAVNNLDTGVQAQILQVSSSDYRLLLASEEAGADGFSLLDASTTDVLQSLGFTSTATSIKNAVSGGAQTDSLESTSTTVGSLLGLSTALSGTVTIGDETVDIDLSTQSLSDIKDAIDAAGPSGVTTSLVTEEVDGSNVFRLQIDGTTTLIDDNNVLEALGILKGIADVAAAVAEEHTGSVGNTTNGSTPIVANTKFEDVYGANVTNGDTIAISGTQRDGTAVSGTYTVANNDRLQDLLNEIETVFGGEVTASVNDSGQVVVTDDTGGTSGLTVSLQTNNEGGGSLTFGTFSATTQGENSRSREVAGQDAVLRVNGLTLTRSTNTVTDALEGVTLSLNDAEAGTTVTVSVDRDITAVRSSIESFVTDYNEALSLISAQFEYDEENETSGPLGGDSTLLTLQSQLRTLATSQVTGLPDGQNQMTLFGISFNRDGLLEIDSDTLNNALSDDLTALRRVFVADGSTSDADIEFVYQTDDTSAGSFDVSITTAAEQASVLGTTDLTVGLAADETITITDLLTDRSESIDLSTGDDIDAIVSKINAELASNVAELRTGSEANTTDGVTPITASTTFDSINGAGVTADDTIDIQGTLHGGARVSGSFTLSDPSTQTVGDLLAEIRSIFQGTVSASVDSSGQIAITDNEVGNSDLTLVMIERNEGGGSLDFGGFDVTAEGRYSMGVTASNDGGMLKLTADAYGADAGFTVSQTSNETGITDDTYNGVDVAGTINGESATGEGRILAGDTESSSIAGLSLRVMLTPDQLTTQGTDQGTVTVTQGVGDLLRRSLESITDPFEGMIVTRETAIEDTIESSQDQISAMEVRISLMRDTLIRQFTAMETAVTQYNSLGSFLGSQLASLSASTGGA